MEAASKELLFYAAEGTTSELEKAIKSNQEWMTLKDVRGRSAIFHAAISDNVKNFQLLIKKGSSPWEKDAMDATPLHWAVKCGATKVARVIISSRDPSGRAACLLQDKQLVTPLHVAASRGCARMLKLLMESLSLPSDNVYVLAQDSRGRSPLHYAASRASIECVRTILDSTNIGLPVDQKDNNGVTPLMCAVGVCLPQAVDVCRLLSIRKSIAVSARAANGLSALHIAVAADNIAVVDLLVNELNCSVEVFDNENRTPLHYAAEQGQVKMVKLLLSKGARNITRDKHGVTPAHYAAQFSRECLETILDHSKITEVKDNEQRSCLMWAVCAGNIDVIKYFLSRATADRYDRDFRGFTALHLAAMMGSVQICKLLVKQGWTNAERDKQENTPLHLAAGRGHTDVVNFLVTKGAALNEKDAMGRTPIFWACLGGRAHTLYIMIREMGFEWRTPGGSSKPLTDALGRTALHAATFAGYTPCINVLLEIEAKDNWLQSPLVGAEDHDRDTALHVACARGKLDCALVLLKGGAAINAHNRARKTPIMTAEEHNHSNIVDYLRTQGGQTWSQLQLAATIVLQRRWKQIREHRRSFLRPTPQIRARPPRFSRGSE